MGLVFTANDKSGKNSFLLHTTSSLTANNQKWFSRKEEVKPLTLRNRIFLRSLAELFKK